ncbi:hypothetical protein NBG4_340014 [Candidatus Sulfobium mesophilum]|uniref:Uncharacterized protein n=1 Tax=Candidatus Sulfobium mesophilum TaxID=2016548 RepID=A0A2U3QHE8_9BACT|nr:hypothetical protein NBG4_340014 [Candidatus Sulfobium mesophilum]
MFDSRGKKGLVSFDKGESNSEKVIVFLCMRYLNIQYTFLYKIINSGRACQT